MAAFPAAKGAAEGPAASGAAGTTDEASAPKKQQGRKVGRNDPCPCGSGLKWKKCTCEKYHPKDGSQPYV